MSSQIQRKLGKFKFRKKFYKKQKTKRFIILPFILNNQLKINVAADKLDCYKLISNRGSHIKQQFKKTKQKATEIVFEIFWCNTFILRFHIEQNCTPKLKSELVYEKNVKKLKFFCTRNC